MFRDAGGSINGVEPANTLPQGGALRLNHVSKSYGSMRAVDDVSITIERGEFVTLLGPSGSGKTTLLRIIAGLEVPDSGSVTCWGGAALANGVRFSN